ncbi:HlyD family secretion protein [Sedimentibacter sp. MB31-C6]|uniref:HlyD family secretion protein n=1 Tax=Sedimentibacter sp. MB31-C6 TaxID=3109366 RepID=UPI002DDCBED4|nr:HlyD family efflux transporter periplasmic adaptor subunit [Sedimentibacter sp. MB36-C1]WSI03315.1 HlyD family efflux transporter periplasmic adaptor subunit [Sedimentibacter sp. MB36-C1]
MKNIINHIKEKGKIVIIPFSIVTVLISIFIFNGLQKEDTAIVFAKDGRYIEASGTVESNLIAVSSEVTGTIIESMVKEGDRVEEGDIIAKINNTNITNQYDQSLINMKLSEKNIELIENNINSLEIQNSDSIKQAENAYLSAEAEFEKVMDGASVDEIKQAEEAVIQAEINLEYIRTNLERSKELLEEEAISQSKYDEILKNYNVAETQYNSAVSQLNIVKSYPTETSIKAAENKMFQAKAGYELSISNGNTQIQQLESQLEIAKVQFEQSKNIVEQSKIELEKLTIKSPVDGIVNSLLVKEGEFISTGKLVADIYNPDNIEIKAYVSEANIGHIIIGQDVEVFIDSDNNKIFKGKVTRVSNEAEFTPKNIQTKEERVNTVFEVKIEVFDSDGFIKPGMPVDINIKID